jgi:hypothetical protein
VARRLLSVARATVEAGVIRRWLARLASWVRDEPRDIDRPSFAGDFLESKRAYLERAMDTAKLVSGEGSQIFAVPYTITIETACKVCGAPAETTHADSCEEACPLCHEDDDGCYCRYDAELRTE